MAMPQQISRTVKLAALGEFAEGKSVAQIASKFGVSRRAVRHWIKGRGMQRVGKMIGKPTAPRRVRLVLAKAKQIGSITAAAREAGVPRSTVYEWSYRYG